MIEDETYWSDESALESVEDECLRLGLTQDMIDRFKAQVLVYNFYSLGGGFNTLAIRASERDASYLGDIRKP